MLIEQNIDEFCNDINTYELIIDARSPKEFKESHLPTAINFYALSDKEHHEIGEMYVQKSKPDAKVLGASYICHNAAEHLKTIYQKCQIGSKIGIYCAKGGLRSTSLATILSFTGYRVYKIERGYKDYRSYVLKYLENFRHKNFLVLGGNTGCGKSELIQKLTPSIDLENLANHFGSTFGLMNGAQPSQKAFENELVYKLGNIDENSWIFIEGESKRIGSIIQPDLLYKRFQESIRIEVTAPLEQRVQRILKDYINIDDEYFFNSMNIITPYIRKSSKKEAIKSYENRDLAKVAEILLVDYYDQVYRKPKNIKYIVDNTNESEALSCLKEIQLELNHLG
ncbi:tRNA 2-selenouridine(34) synthase MnmH [Sulfurospirillum arcachonense]|uniref:tRNA 2-selenouridine(34) synthase MnmH n=1 Tax=Sulfurospirillum arcachonense TaxID=57666 RepID=UPI00046A62E8|nr:tRNA 2-selenouridine(34) synthase MnmH [Sulfurospirillum arcachonense]